MKKIIALSLAVLSAVVITGCSANTANNSSIDDDIASSETKTSATDATTTPKPETSVTTTIAETTTTMPETTTTTAETTVPETTTATVPSVTPETPAPEWSESKASGVKYVNTSCLSREKAVQGSATVRPYDVNDEVTVVALTDTGYYKLDNGTFIHSDYLSDTKVSVSLPSSSTTTISFNPSDIVTHPKPPLGTAKPIDPSETLGINGSEYFD